MVACHSPSPFLLLLSLCYVAFSNGKYFFLETENFVDATRLAHHNNWDVDVLLQDIPWPRMPRNYFNGSWDHPHSRDILTKALVSDESWLATAVGLLPQHKVHLISGIVNGTKNKIILPPSFYPLFVDVISFFEYIYPHFGPKVLEEHVNIFIPDLSPMLADDLVKAIDTKGLSLLHFRKAVSLKATVPAYKAYYNKCLQLLSNDAQNQYFAAILFPSIFAVVILLL